MGLDRGTLAIIDNYESRDGKRCGCSHRMLSDLESAVVRIVLKYRFLWHCLERSKLLFTGDETDVSIRWRKKAISAH